MISFSAATHRHPKRLRARMTWRKILVSPVAMIFFASLACTSAAKSNKPSSPSGGKVKGGKVEKYSKFKFSSKHSKKGKKSNAGISVMKILQKATDAIGGEDVLMGLVSLKMETTGATWIMFETEDPSDLVATSTYKRTYTSEFDNDRHRIDERIVPLFEGLYLFPPVTFSRVINGNVGGMDKQVQFNVNGTMPSEHVAALKRQQLLFNPHLLLQKAKRHPEIISSRGKSKGHFILVIEDEVFDICLHVDKDTGLISKLHTMESNPLVRDTELMVIYKDWIIEANGLLFPEKVEMYGIHGKLWEETRSFVEIDMVHLMDDSIFGFPAGTDPASFDAAGYEFGLQSHHNVEGFFQLGVPFVLVPGFGPTTELANGIYLLLSLTNSMVVRHRHGVVVLEAPASDSHGRALVNAVQELVPNTRITHVVQSHHHVDHASGVREVVAAGATLVVGHGVKRFWKQVLKADSKIRPDSLSGKRHSIKKVKKKEKLVLVDEPDLVVTVYHTDRDPHAEDAVFTAIKTGGTIYLYVADMYNAGFGLILGGPEGFFDAMRDVGLIDSNCRAEDPLFIVSAHNAVVQKLEDSVVELMSLGIDVGCT